MNLNLTGGTLDGVWMVWSRVTRGEVWEDDVRDRIGRPEEGWGREGGLLGHWFTCWVRFRSWDPRVLELGGEVGSEGPGVGVEIPVVVFG